MPIDKIAKVSHLTLALLMIAVFFAALSAATHTHFHLLSYIFLVPASGFGILALLKVFNSISVHLPKPIGRVIRWMHAMAFEIFALLAIPFLRLIHSPLPVGLATGRPILLVHGYCNSGAVWIYFRRYFKEKNLGPIYTIDLGNPFRSLSEYAQKVAEKAKQIRKETGRPDLVLIGHSMGGLVSMLYALNLAEENTVTDVVTIGSPIAGTYAAMLGIGKNASEMRRSSTLLVALAEKLAKESPIRFYHIATQTDQLIIPSSSALRGLANREFLFEDLGHASLLFSPRVAQLIAGWLSDV